MFMNWLFVRFTFPSHMKVNMHNAIISVICVFLALISSQAYSQAEQSEKFIPAIEDNSMFIEEAYNQEARVVQHISNLVFLPNLKDNFYYSFTQEWPVFSIKNQLSYSVLYNSLDKGTSSGLGDMMINYRYQLSYKEDFIACSPRLSIIIPTGNKDKGLGYGSWGLQAGIPFSKRWTNHFISHLNIGSTYLFNVRQEDAHFNNSLVSYSAGISAIWLLTEKLNLMLECLTNFTANPGLNNNVIYTHQTILAPAFRYAIDLKKLQIVPGISVPFTFNKDSKVETGGFFYLSFEHGF
jgi:hypothetical protein